MVPGKGLGKGRAISNACNECRVCWDAWNAKTVVEAVVVSPRIHRVQPLDLWTSVDRRFSPLPALGLEFYAVVIQVGGVAGWKFERR